MLLAGSVEGKQGGRDRGGEGVGREIGFGRREAGGVEAWSAARNEVFSFHPQKAECERTGPGSVQPHCSLCL